MRTKLIVTAFSISIFWAVSLGIYRPSSAAQPVNPSSDPHLLAPADEAPRYGDYVTQSLYIPMRDDVQIAIDVVLPKGLPANEKIPTILNQTRYWRAYDFRRIAGDPKLLDPRRDFKLFFAQRGYALIFADVRGTGASFGSNPYPWSPDEIQDGNDIVEWIIAQPWSDGRVGAIGVSYEGSTAQFLAVPNHPAVKAVIPQFMEYDVYSHIAFPGGVFNDWFVRVWSHQNSLLDRNIICEDTTPDCRLSRLFIRGVKPVDSDRHRGQLRQAIQEHQQNGDLYGAAQNVTFRDDYSAELQTTIDGFSVHTYNPAIEQSNIAIYGWGSWMDAGTADGVINRLLTLRNPQKAIIGPWNHGASQDADPFLPSNTPVQPSVPEQRRMALRFFDFYLKDIDTGIMSEPALTYYTLGEGKWKVTDVWPPAGVMNQRWYLAADGALSRNAPIFASGEDTYTVDFEATTGLLNRWITEAGGFDVIYPNRAEEDHRLLTYTSQPLAKDTEITGHPVINLYVTSTHTDGAFFVYLEDVDENGRVTYITEGQLRAIHRRISSDAPPYQQLTPYPYHSFKKEDAMPLVPGEMTQLHFGLLPTSALIKQGHRIRIAIAGHDKSVFARISAENTLTITVSRNKRGASFIDLPVVPRKMNHAF